MKKIDAFTNLYSLSKTLQFSLIPVGETEQNFVKNGVLSDDEHRTESYGKVKKLIDRYHIAFIDSVLGAIEKLPVEKYLALYRKSGKTPEELKALEKEEETLRKSIADAFHKDARYKKVFEKELISELLPSFLKNDEERSVVAEFSSFTTYFRDFYKNRENMYSAEPIATGIAYRLINENLPKYIDNCKSFIKIAALLPVEQMIEFRENFGVLFGELIPEDRCFREEEYRCVLTQQNIDAYNQILGGYTTSDGRKIQGLNEYINLYNQIHKKEERLPFLKPLYKQILSERTTVSFLPEKFASDGEVLETIELFYKSLSERVIPVWKEIFTAFSEYRADGIFLRAGLPITAVSKAVTEDWGAVAAAWNAAYDEKSAPKKLTDAYYEKRAKAYKAIKSFSLQELQDLIGEKGSVTEYYETETLVRIDRIAACYTEARELLHTPYTNGKLIKDDNAIEKIKNLLDACKALEELVKPLLGTGKEENKDESFYGAFLPAWDILKDLDQLYDKTRNYMTQKPYSTEKFRLTFGNPQFMGSWPVSKEADYMTLIFREHETYYLGVMHPKHKKEFRQYPAPADEFDVWEKMNYLQAADPSKDVQNLMVIDGRTVKKNGRKNEEGNNVILEDLKNEYLPVEINRIRKSRSYSKGSTTFDKSDLIKYIDYYKARVIEYYDQFQLEFKDSADYRDFADFTDDINRQAYQLRFLQISKKHVLKLVSEGKLYLFRIYNKDFSEHSKGTPNLHTLYFKMLFDPRNLEAGVFQLNGGAEMFYRKASIEEKDQITHPAGQPVNNKNPLNPRKTSTFDYTLIKDRRYTKPQFSLHLPISLNYRALDAVKINEEVRRRLRAEGSYVIGIDRGERNLIYACVIDPQGKIVEQCSLNEIVSTYQGIEHRVDYHRLLDKKEIEREEAREKWTAVENIKELKDGYISQVVRKICDWVIRYDAVIAMEDLNSGFKNSRIKVEKQVYQKFEKMLIEKLNYLADKQGNPESLGGILHAYQLTNKFSSFKEMTRQNGFIFYVPAWLTSKIDPTTGFADMLKPKYESVSAARDFLSRFEKIGYNAKEGYYEFTFCYSSFPKAIDKRDRWTLCTHGERIRSYRDKRNGNLVQETVVLIDEFRALFGKFGIADSADMKNAICEQETKEFWEHLLQLLALTLQMRNSIARDTDIDYLISPVKNAEGYFFDSREKRAGLPENADANGAYNIARKALWIVRRFQAASEDDLMKVKTAISNREWLEFAEEV